MTVKRTIHQSWGIYFITFTCTGWIPLFELTQSYDTVYKWFDVLQSSGHHVLGYVIMPNHLHVLVAFCQNEKGVNKIVSNGKRFMAYEIVKRLTQNNNTILLKQLSDAVTPAEQKRGKLHQVFKPSFDAKECRTDQFIWQKLNYIHQNPVSGKWKLADEAMTYLHSSAKFYDTGEQGIYLVLNFNLLNDMQWADGS
jgi:REP element-mobilizing transposase RayT